MNTLVQAITDCGDLAILLPVACVLTLWAALIGKSGIFHGWLVALAVCVGGTAILKIYFFACPPFPDLHGPSGHTSLSTLVYGSLTFVVARTLAGWRRWLVVLAGASFIACIAISRLIVEAHSIPEVLFGFALGLAALLLFSSAYLRDTPTKTYLIPLIAISAMLVILLDGHELRAEELLHRIASYLNIASRCRA